ncbi:MAG TPA: hypothetical protein VHD56_15410 [Tepidisphaeraceae bacterium]|nr:hypothetical protein [Tepidisphaeraceae bacterium]
MNRLLKSSLWRSSSSVLLVTSVLGCARHATVVVEHRNGPDRIVEEPAPSPGAVVMIDPPPAPVYEAEPAPRPGYVWIQGHYIHENRRYVWTPGRFERLPRPDARWEAGRWDHVRGGYVWIDGHWR